jgi:hypothetical protein
MQYKCNQVTSEINTKREQGLLVSCCGCLVAVIFLIVIYYLAKTARLDFQLWDIQTLTASDWTIEYTISEEMWNLFNIQLGSHSQLPISQAAPDHTKYGLPVMTFEAFLEHHFTLKLNQLPKVLEDVDIRIANITFGFDNAKILSLLTQRGTLITKGELEKLPAINAEIDKLCKTKKTELTRPVAAFITFQRQEGRDRAIKYFCDQKKERKQQEQNENPTEQELREREQVAKVDRVLLGEDIVVEQAPEPSEILWHNRHITDKQARLHKVVVFIICFLFLFAMFLFFTWMKSKAIKNMWRYPSTTNCNSVASQFTLNGQIDTAMYAYYAEYVDMALTVERQGTGIYQCYCKDYADIVSASSNSGPDAFCNTWFRQAYGGYAIGELVTVAITVVNIIIRSLCIFLLKKVGYHTETEEITAIMMTIFIATFFNTAILLLLADADLQQVKLLSWIPGLNGPFPDLTEQWYIIIGPSMILTMFLNSIYPWIDFGISFGTIMASRIMDQGCKSYCCCHKDKTTKAKTIQAYVNIYAGPIHAMSFKYSAILTTVTVTFMYGMALPELFPIAAFTFFNYYIFDRLLIVYYYRMPPIYDDKLNQATLDTMKYAPLLLLFFGYWCMGNMQIFNDQLVPLVNTSIPLTTDHFVYP